MFLHDIDFDENIGSAKLGLHGDSADSYWEMRPAILHAAREEERKKHSRLFYVLPSSDPEVIEKVAITNTTTFEGVRQDASHSLSDPGAGQMRRLTWQLSPNPTNKPATPLDDAAEWVCAVKHAREILRRKKGSDVEIIIGLDEPQCGP